MQTHHKKKTHFLIFWLESAVLSTWQDVSGGPPAFGRPHVNGYEKRKLEIRFPRAVFV